MPELPEESQKFIVYGLSLMGRDRINAGIA